MAVPFLPALVAAVSGLLFRRAGASDRDGGHDGGEEGDRPRTARSLSALLAALLAFLALYHFLVWPVLNHHFPEYDFPPLDLAALSATLAAVGSM